MPRALCFVIMPYGTKESNATLGSAAPSRVDFDALWYDAFRPAIEALGYEAVRADFDLGGMIIHEMLQRLALCDLVIADISISNANVYYEVGVRHAAARRGCVLVAAEWAQVPFDLNQIRQLRYRLPEEKVGAEAASAIAATLKENVPNLAKGDSPVFTAVPGFPDKPALEHMSAFRARLDQLAAFQTACGAARSLPAAEARVEALAIRDAHGEDAHRQGTIAVELVLLLRDCTDWKTVLAFIDDLPEDIGRLPTIQEQRALAQANDGDALHAIAALRELIRINGDSAERRGMIGGRFKRLWRDTKKATYLDNAIAEYELGMHLDLNDYYPSSNLPGLYRARNRKGDPQRAVAAAAIAAAACERARRVGAADEWLKPTLLVAAFTAGDTESAADLAREVAADGAASWKLDSVLTDLTHAVTIAPPEVAGELDAVLDELRSLIEPVRT